MCCALGIDMYDCVYPTRTAVSYCWVPNMDLPPLSPLQRCGIALVPWGRVDLKHSSCTMNFEPIDPDCGCPTCRTHTRASIHLLIVPKETVACSLLTIHNLHYMVRMFLSVYERRTIIDFLPANSDAKHSSEHSREPVCRVCSGVYEPSSSRE